MKRPYLAADTFFRRSKVTTQVRSLRGGLFLSVSFDDLVETSANVSNMSVALVMLRTITEGFPLEVSLSTAFSRKESFKLASLLAVLLVSLVSSFSRARSVSTCLAYLG